MTRAMVAAGKAQIAALVVRLRLEPDEVARIGASLLHDAGRRAGLDRRGLHAVLDDVVEAAARDEGRHG